MDAWCVAWPKACRGDADKLLPARHEPGFCPKAWSYAVELQEQIRSFIAERFLFDKGAPIDAGQSLMKAGILDSTGAMELVMFLESSFGIKVEDAEIVPANLDTVQALAAFVARKKSEVAA